MMIQWVKDNRKSIVAIFVLYVIQTSALIRADFLYDDDMGRNIEGYSGFNFHSRYLSDLLAKLINGNSHITDTSPMTQLMACFLLALSAAMLLWLIRKEAKIDLMALVSAVVIMSPYFINDMSYKVDAPLMALSVLFGFVPLLWKDDIKKYIPAIVVSTLGICMTYQASSGIFPIMVLLVAFLEYIRGEKELKESLTFTGISALVYLLSMAFFFAFLMNKVEGEGEYFENTPAGISELVPSIVNNIRKMYLIIIGDYSKWWNVFVILLIIAFLVTCVTISTRKRMSTLVYLVITFAFMCLLITGPYIILRKPMFEPRSLYGFSIFLAMMIAVISDEKAIWFLPSKIVAFALAWCLFAFSFTYGNALAEQKRFTEFAMNEVIDDLTDLEAYINNENKEVEIVGSAGYSPVLYNYPYDYDLIRKMVPVFFQQADSGWNCYYFFNYYKLNGVESVRGLNKDEFELVQESSYHKIYNKGNQFIVELTYE